MILAEYKDTLDDGIALAVGNGESLLNVPRLFLEKYTTFGCNFVHWWAKRKLPKDHDLHGFCPDIWCCLDPQSLEAVPDLPGHVLKFAPPGLSKMGNASGMGMNAVYFEVVQGKNEMNYANYSTSLIFAARLAVHFGAKTILVVGFDCSQAKGTGKKVESGITGAPHFYDPGHESIKRVDWDVQFKTFSDWARERGVRVLNLSEPTAATRLERDSLENWM